MTRILALAMRLTVLAGLFATSLGFDPLSHQVFREPKMLALVWIGGFLLIAWAIASLTSLFQGTTFELPPLPILALVPLILMVCWSGWSLFQDPTFSSGYGDRIPVRVHYQIHVLLPVLAWIAVFACASFLFRNPSRLRRLGGVVFLALACQTTIVLAEAVENWTGIRVNPVGWLGTLDVETGVVKQRIFGTIGNPNFVGGYLAIALVAATGWVIGLRRNYARFLGGLVLSAALLSIVLTRSKGALLALAVGVAHGLVVGRLARQVRGTDRREFGVRRWAPGALILVLVVVAAGFFLVESSSDPREGSYIERWAETLALRGDSITVRALLAHCGFDMWEDKPFLGWGAGGFKVNFLERLKALLEGPEGDRLLGRVNRLHSLRANHLHNEYLQVLVEWGILGFAFVQLFLVGCQVLAFRRIKVAKSSAERFMRIGLLSAFWCGLGGALFDMPFHRPAQAFLLAVVLGASVGGWDRDPQVARSQSGLRWLFATTLAILSLPMGAWLAIQADGKYIAQRNVFVASRILEGAVSNADPGKVESALRKAGDLAPGEGDYDYLRALFDLEARGDPAAAVVRIRRARLTCDDPSLYLIEARAQIERSNFGSAGPILEFVEAIDPDRRTLHYLKGRVFQSQGKWDAACAAYDLEITNAEAYGWESSPHLAQCYFRMGDILERELGQYTQAAGCYRKLVELQGDSKQGYPAAQIRLAEMYRDRFFDLDRSETYFREALEILEYQGQSPEAASIRERIAEIEKRREDYRSVSQ